MNLENVNWCFQPMKLWTETKNRNGIFCPFAGKPNGRIIFSIWEKLEKHQRDARRIGMIQTVLIGTDSDVFGGRIRLFNNQQIPLKVDSNTIRRELFGRIIEGKYPNLIFLFLTDHPSKIKKCIPKEWLRVLPGNVMFGVSGNSSKEIGYNLNTLSKAPGKKFIYIKPECADMNLTEISSVNEVAAFIQEYRTSNIRRVRTTGFHPWLSSMSKDRKKGNFNIYKF